MKLLVFSLLFSLSASLPGLDLSALQAAANWPEIEAALKSQRAEIVAAHEATLAATAAKLRAAEAAVLEAKAAQKEAQDDLAAYKQRVRDTLTKYSQRTDLTTFQLVAALIEESQKTEKQIRLEAIAAEKARLEAEALKLSTEH